MVGIGGFSLIPDFLSININCPLPNHKTPGALSYICAGLALNDLVTNIIRRTSWLPNRGFTIPHRIFHRHR